jgi:hypothetical protein
MIDLSHALGRGAILGLAFFFGVAQGGPVVEVTSHEGLLAVHAVDAPMRDVLEAIAAHCDLEIQALAPLEQHISFHTEPLTLHGLLSRLLRDQSYLLLQGLTPTGASRLKILSSRQVSATERWQTSPDVAALPGVAQREDAVYALADARESPEVALLAEYMHDPSQRVRIAAVVALADDASDAALHALGEALVASDPAVRKHIVDTLADIDTPYATELLQQALGDELPLVVSMASEYLAERLRAAGR